MTTLYITIPTKLLDCWFAVMDQASTHSCHALSRQVQTTIHSNGFCCTIWGTLEARGLSSHFGCRAVSGSLLSGSTRAAALELQQSRS